MFCRLVQWRIEKEWDDDGRIKDPRTLRHLDVCPTCQRWLQSLKQIDRHLQTEAPGISDSQIEQIQTAVLQHVAATDTRQKTLLPARFKYAISAAAAVIIIAIGWFSFYASESDNHRNNEYANPVAQLSPPLQFQIPILAGLPDALLETQMQNMQTDVRRAMTFVQNCLPRELIAAHLPAENTDAI